MLCPETFQLFFVFDAMKNSPFQVFAQWHFYVGVFLIATSCLLSSGYPYPSLASFMCGFICLYHGYLAVIKVYLSKTCVKL